MSGKYIKRGFHSGGSGYVIGQLAFKQLGSLLSNNFKSCPNTGVEDVDVNGCLRSLGVEMGDSTDEKGRLRFLSSNLMKFYTGKLVFLIL